MRARLRFSPLLILLGLAPGCDSTPGPTTGAVRLISQTTGGDLDLDGYVATVDHVAHVVPINGTVLVADLATGSHEVTLTGIAANCVPTSATQSAVVRAGDTTDVGLVVACVASGVRVTAATGGLDISVNGHSVSVDGVVVGRVGANASFQMTRLSPGSHAISLGVASNCAITGNNPRSVAITAGSIEPVDFVVSCTATTGVIEVVAATTGVELDGDGYKVQIDNSPLYTLAINGTVRFSGMSAGSHSITVSGMSSNCSVAAANPRNVTVTTGGAVRDTVRTSFAVSCVATTGSIRIVAVTSGAELDPDGYSLALDDCYYCSGWSGSVASNGEVTTESVSTGDHWLTIAGVQRNCTLAGANPRSVSVPPAATATVTIEVTCVQSGSIAVTVATGGVDPDPNGYAVSLVGPISLGRHAAVNEAMTFDTLTPGDYQVSLNDVAFNCTLTGAPSRLVTVAGGETRSVSFDVTCSAARQLAFVSNVDGNDEIYRVSSNGSGFTRLTMNSTFDIEPAWSPDGSKIAFRSIRDGNSEIYVMNWDGSNQMRLTTNPANDYQPTWSPDGSKIAFISDRGGHVDIYVMNATDGSNVVQLTSDGAAPTSEGDPAWSSTNQIAFWRAGAGLADIWVMEGDGTNPHQVTTTGSNSQPAWSPDGTRLVYRHNTGCDYYYCYDFLAVINADGSGNASITPEVNEPAADPDWSPDGQWIVFGAQVCSYYGYYYYYLSCYETGLSAVHPDGSGRTPILSGSFRGPAWRPGAN